MIQTVEHLLKPRVLDRLNLSADISDEAYSVAVRAAIGVIMRNTDSVPNYPEDATSVRLVEDEYMLRSGNENLRRSYADLVIFAAGGVPFFWITASPFTRCEAIILLLVNPPPKPPTNEA